MPAAQANMMANLTTVLTLMFGAGATLLTAADLYTWAARAVLAASIAIGSTMVGLVAAIFYQMLARQVKDSEEFLTKNSLATILSCFPLVGVTLSCLSCPLPLAWPSHSVSALRGGKDKITTTSEMRQPMPPTSWALPSFSASSRCACTLRSYAIPWRFPDQHALSVRLLGVLLDVSLGYGVCDCGLLVNAALCFFAKVVY